MRSWGSRDGCDGWSGGVPTFDGYGGGSVGIGLEIMTMVVGRGRGDWSDDVDGDEVMKMVRVACRGDGGDESQGGVVRTRVCSVAAKVMDISNMDKNEPKRTKSEHGIGRVQEIKAEGVFIFNRPTRTHFNGPGQPIMIHTKPLI
ncbi:hypothetical protein Tco_0121780 [Tanacetum coccineum]